MQNGSAWKRRFFLVVFGVLTLLCWCPIGYGAYGPPSLVLGMPAWAVTALGIGIVMFLVELVFLFGSDLTLDDDELPDMIRAIQDAVK